MSLFIPSFTSEFPDHLVRDCVPSAGLMLANKVTHNAHPAGTAEREALQEAMGTQDAGADNQQLQAGLSKRYGLSTQLVRGWETISNRLAVTSHGLAIIGEYPKLPDAIRNHGLQPSYAGLHDIYAQGMGNGQVLVGDPLGASMGPTVDLSALRGYVESTAYDALLGTEQAPRIVAYRLYTSGGPMTLWHVMRFTHYLYGPVTHTYEKGSPAPVAHGARGFWMYTAGPLRGLYAVYGRTQAFTIRAVYSDGHTEPVPTNS